MRPLNALIARTLRLTPLALATMALVACGGSNSGGSPPIGTIKGTVAVGAPMANAQIQLACKQGATNVTTDVNGAYNATFPFDGPCIITVTSASTPTVLNSFASGPGTYNITTLTQLLLIYLAAQLNTTLSGLVNGMASNPTYQSALTNSTAIANAEQGVATLLEQTYGVTLSTTSFLTVSFTPGQAPDQDLDKLQATGYLENGEPSSTLVASTAAAGTAAGPIPTGGAGGATGGTGTTTQ